MRVLLINEVLGTTSTGRICAKLAEELKEQGHEVKVAYGRWGKVPEEYKAMGVRIGSAIDVYMHGIMTRFLDAHGLASKRATKRFLKWADDYNPDLVWLHNIHGYYIHYPLLFEWIKGRDNIQVKWTLHDCFPITGHCVHFEQVGCEKYKTQCEKCPQLHTYPASVWADRSKQNYLMKKKNFCGVKNMTLITATEWMTGIIRQSFLSEYPISVVKNQVDTKVFTYTESDFRKKYNLEHKKMILGVSNNWDVPQKGLMDMLQLADMLDDSYICVLVGLSEKEKRRYAKKQSSMRNKKNHKTISGDLDSKESAKLETVIKTSHGMAIEPGVTHLYEALTGNVFESVKPASHADVVCIEKTDNKKQLAEIYSAADFFVNPTYQDHFPTVNLEAIACGTYVICYNVGGCAETL